MARIKLDHPSAYAFETYLPLRITDVNYGGHVGNDTVLTLLHEARVQFLAHVGLAELNSNGIGFIMSDVAIEFKKELFYGNKLKASMVALDFSRVGFDIFYKLEIVDEAATHIAVLAKTGMICYNYELKKIAALDPDLMHKLGAKSA